MGVGLREQTLGIDSRQSLENALPLSRARLHQGMESELREMQSLDGLTCDHTGPGDTTSKEGDISEHAARAEQWALLLRQTLPFGLNHT